MSLEDLLAADTITVEQPQTTTDAFGGLSPGWDSFAVGPGRVEAASAGAREMYAAQGSVISHVVYTQIDGIRQGFRITTSTGVYLRVEGSMPSIQLGVISTFFAIACRQVQL